MGTGKRWSLRLVQQSPPVIAPQSPCTVCARGEPHGTYESVARVVLTAEHARAVSSRRGAARQCELHLIEVREHHDCVDAPDQLRAQALAHPHQDGALDRRERGGLPASDATHSYRSFAAAGYLHELHADAAILRLRGQ